MTYSSYVSLSLGYKRKDLECIFATRFFLPVLNVSYVGLSLFFLSIMEVKSLQSRASMEEKTIKSGCHDDFSYLFVGGLCLFATVFIIIIHLFSVVMVSFMIMAFLTWTCHHFFISLHSPEVDFYIDSTSIFSLSSS